MTRRSSFPGGGNGVLRPCSPLETEGSLHYHPSYLRAPHTPTSEFEVPIPSLSNLKPKPLILDLRPLCPSTIGCVNPYYALSPVCASHHMAAAAVRVSGGSHWCRRSEHCQRGGLEPGDEPSGPGREHACGSSAGSAHPCPVGSPGEGQEKKEIAGHLSTCCWRAWGQDEAKVRVTV